VRIPFVFVKKQNADTHWRVPNPHLNLSRGSKWAELSWAAAGTRYLVRYGVLYSSLNTEVGHSKRCNSNYSPVIVWLLLNSVGLNVQYVVLTIL
jgi:hypothetical protein